ncbi:MAG: SUMF1/EgtB/PvdO family nonheme iron enzyme [Pseudomonadota bacterium]
METFGLLLTGVSALLAHGCLVQERCAEDRDCLDGQTCDLATGACGEGECQEDADCGGVPFTCEGHRCVEDCSEEVLDCPAGMVSICGAYCVDIYEASRPDATATDAGTDGSRAVSQEGVMPWYSNDATAGMNPQIAAAACAAAGKRLCTPQEWELVCATTERLSYSYGDDYSPPICNGIDTFCDCDGDGEPDGDAAYPGCRAECDTDFHPTPTGAFLGCTNAYGVFDINGNVWEVVDTDDGYVHYRGGAFNCSNSELLHRCDYDGVESGNFPSAKGFRCCADGAEAP